LSDFSDRFLCFFTKEAGKAEGKQRKAEKIEKTEKTENKLDGTELRPN
jgi:hypothetical protein